MAKGVIAAKKRKVKRPRVKRPAAKRPAKAFPAATAMRATADVMQPIVGALGGDLVTVRKRLPAKGKRGLKSTPTDIELHLNPLGMGAAAVGGALALWLLQLRVMPVMKEVTTTYGQWKWPAYWDASIGAYFEETWASAQLEYDKRGVAPTKEYVSEIQTVQVTVADPQPIYEEQCCEWDVVDGRRVCVDYEQVIVGYTDPTFETREVPVYSTLVAYWVEQKTVTEKRKIPSIESRAGFLGAGIGTDVPTIGEVADPGGFWSSLLGIKL